MKTKNIFLYLPLLLVLMLGTMGCGSDDEVDMTIEQVRNIDESVAVFFENELGKFDIQKNSNCCSVINSEKDFRACYNGNEELPNIDFDRFTLVIGQVEAPHTGCHIMDVRLVQLDQLFLNVTLYVGNSGYTMTTYLRFWRLYPKLQSSIQMNVIKQNAK